MLIVTVIFLVPNVAPDMCYIKKNVWVGVGMGTSEVLETAAGVCSLVFRSV